MIARMVVMLVVLGGTLHAADPIERNESNDQPASTDDALLRELLGEPAAGETVPDAAATPGGAGPAQEAPSRPESAAPAVDPQAIDRIVASLRDAETSLSGGRTDEPTQTAQQQAITELERLIEAARRQRSKAQGSSQPESGSSAPQPAGMPSPTPGAAGAAGPTGSPGASAGQHVQGQNGKAEDSSDQFRSGDAPTQALRNFRFELIRDDWGHLPPRIRDQLLGTGSDRYLPQYDRLVRQYFESLAQPEDRTREPRP